MSTQASSPATVTLDVRGNKLLQLVRDEIARGKSPTNSADRKKLYKQVEELNDAFPAVSLDKFSDTELLNVFKHVISLVTPKKSSPSSSNSAPTIDRADFAEDVLAREFSKEHCSELKYTPAMKTWKRWNGVYWELDNILHIFKLGRSFTQKKANEIPDDAIGRGEVVKDIRSAHTINAIEKLARADDCHSVRPDTWDTNKMLLGTPAGTVDLRTGELRKPDPSDFISKVTAVAPAAPGTPHPLWTKFLQDVTNNDANLQSFLQRLSGYSLTGLTVEQSVEFFFGPGGNGKSTFVETVRDILGDEYATVIAAHILKKSKNDQHSTSIAKLNGRRLAVASETDSDQAWNESRLKSFTGGEKQTARKMRQDDVDFDPQFKIWIVGNNKPRLEKVDEGWRRRFHIIPFLQKISSPDRFFREKLRAEWPAILRWAIDGCLAWQQHGLNPPDVVLAATAEYLDTEDLTGQWVEDRCVLSPDGQATSFDLHQSYLGWMAQHGEHDRKPLSQSKLTSYLKDSLPGIESCTIGHKNARGLRGIRLRQVEPVRSELLEPGSDEAHEE